MREVQRKPGLESEPGNSESLHVFRQPLVGKPLNSYRACTQPSPHRYGDVLREGIRVVHRAAVLTTGQDGSGPTNAPLGDAQ